VTRFFLFAFFVLAFFSAKPLPATAATAHAGQVVMGTVLQVSVVADDMGRARELASQAVHVARHWDHVLTTWRPEGELAALNAMAGKGPQPVTGDLLFALTTMSRLSSLTDGAFDPGVGPLVRRFSSPGVTGPAPSSATRIREVLKIKAGFGELLAGAALDAGGIGKGIALDAIAESLRSGGAKGAYSDFGGSSQLAFGARNDGAPWTLALGGLGPGTTHGFVRLDGALSTSRSRPPGDAAGPIVDPHTRRVVEAPRFATCYAPSASAAEACSKAFIVLGWAAYDPVRRPGWEALYEDAYGFRSSPGFVAMVSPRPDTIAQTHDSSAPKKISR
jgi:thiamine biosynthesis lipoprotein